MFLCIVRKEVGQQGSASPEPSRQRGQGGWANHFTTSAFRSESRRPCLSRKGVHPPIRGSRGDDKVFGLLQKCLPRVFNATTRKKFGDRWTRTYVKPPTENKDL